MCVCVCASVCVCLCVCVCVCDGSGGRTRLVTLDLRTFYALYYTVLVHDWKLHNRGAVAS